jgi:hypothetical protein
MCSLSFTFGMLPLWACQALAASRETSHGECSLVEYRIPRVIFALIPIYIRIMQCARRYSEVKQGLHPNITNLLKYSLQGTFVLLSAWRSESGPYTFSIYLIFCSLRWKSRQLIFREIEIVFQCFSFESNSSYLTLPIFTIFYNDFPNLSLNFSYCSVI